MRAKARDGDEESKLKLTHFPHIAPNISPSLHQDILPLAFTHRFDKPLTLNFFPHPSEIYNMKQYRKYVESANADNYYHVDPVNTWLKNSESAFYQGQLFNSPQLWNSNLFMSGETMYILRCYESS